MSVELHNPHWPNYQGWSLIINHVWAATIANPALSLTNWIPASEMDYFSPT